MTGMIFYQTALFQVDIQNIFRSAYFFCFDVDFDVFSAFLICRKTTNTLQKRKQKP